MNTTTAPRTRLDAAALLAGTTPGPWVIRSDGGPRNVQQSGSGFQVALTRFVGTKECDKATEEANARLIAAAPALAARVLELDAALRMAQTWIQEAKSAGCALPSENTERQMRAALGAAP